MGDDDADMMTLSPDMVAGWAADLELSPLVLPASDAAAAPPELALPRQRGCATEDDTENLVIAQHRQWRDKLRAALTSPHTAATPSTMTMLALTAVDENDPIVTVRVLCGMSEVQVRSLEAPARELVTGLRARVLERQRKLGLLPEQSEPSRLGEGLI